MPTSAWSPPDGDIVIVHRRYEGLGPKPAGFVGAYRTLSALAVPNQRAGLIAAIFALSYLALSIPVVIAGVADTHFGLHRTASVYCGTLAVLGAVAAGSFMFRRPPGGMTQRIFPRPSIAKV
jgi:hypothetical protein